LECRVVYFSRSFTLEIEVYPETGWIQGQMFTVEAVD